MGAKLSTAAAVKGASSCQELKATTGAVVDCAYPKSLRLRTRRQYQRLSHHAVRHVGQLIIIDTRTNRNLITRLGITVTKRYGKAHQRNRFKRVVREAFRLCRLKLPAGLDLNVKPRNGAYLAHPADIQAELLRFLTVPVAS